MTRMMRMMRHEVRRDSDDALIFVHLTPEGYGVSWTPGPGFDPGYPNGYHWQVIELEPLETEEAMATTHDGPPVGYGETELTMSNFDGQIDNGLDVALKGGQVFARHAAWDFNGRVWWDGERFREQVWVHGSPVQTLAAESLEDLMREVNDEFGWR